jgi:hypothetical protein
MSSLIVYVLIGKLSIYLIQKFPLTDYLSSKWKPLEQLFSCDLCLGVWVYWFYSHLFRLNFMQEWFYIPVLCELLTGAITSFVIFIFSLGWKDAFGVFEVK